MLTILEMSTGMLTKSEREEEYGQEVMGVEWNPVVAAMQEAADELAGQAIRRHTMPAELTDVDVDAFLRKMYAAQH